MATRAQQWWDGIGIAGAIILGIVLFFFPEPATSVLGVIIIVAAALIWFGVDVWEERDLVRREAEETDD
ncbi:hypothetical protein JCM30237_28490 [Halolamina litorea]|uniref:Uncharacterized protein n=1 Tax=Halolamina litorea TaxID=1515593 RepID=A0ABD6BSZ0_9EURY|nr:hypothetical protein [Halolamina litorea]